LNIWRFDSEGGKQKDNPEGEKLGSIERKISCGRTAIARGAREGQGAASRKREKKVLQVRIRPGSRWGEKTSQSTSAYRGDRLRKESLRKSTKGIFKKIRTNSRGAERGEEGHQLLQAQGGGMGLFGEQRRKRDDRLNLTGEGELKNNPVREKGEERKLS